MAFRIPRPRSRLASRAILAVWLVAVPILLLGVGIWQIGRAEATLAENLQDQLQISDSLARIHALVARDRDATVTFENGSTMSAWLAAGRIEAAASTIDRSVFVARARPPLAWGTAIGAGMALVAGLLGALAASLAGVRARRSRDHLVASFGSLWRVLPVLLGIQVVGFSLCALSGSLFEGSGLWFEEQLSTNGLKLVFITIAVAAMAVGAALLALRGLRRVFALYTPEPFDLAGRAVSEAEAPGLWKFVRDLAARQESLMPDTIVVGLSQGFFVTEAPIRLWPEGRLLDGRTLNVPAPYLALLDASEVTAIIGHELAHFSGEDTAYSRRFAPIHAGLWRAFDALSGNEAGQLVLYPATKLGFHALERFDEAVGHWSRLREIEADRHGSLVCGPEAAASALIRSGLAAPVIHAVLSGAYADPHAVPEADLVEAIAIGARDGGFGDPSAHIEERQPHPTDSHPPTAQRIAALGSALDATLLARAARLPGIEEDASARSLVADWNGLCRTLSRDFLEDAVGAHAAYRAELETHAAAVSDGALELYENVRPLVWVLIGSAILMLGAGAAIAGFAAPLGLSDPDQLMTVLTVIGILGLGLLGLATMVWRRGRKAFMVLTPDALVSPLLKSPIAWTDVGAFQVSAGGRMNLQLAIREGAPLPASALGRITGRVKIHRRKRVVLLSTIGVRGFKPTAYSDLVARYLHASYARQELEAQAQREAQRETGRQDPGAAPASSSVEIPAPEAAPLYSHR